MKAQAKKHEKLRELILHIASRCEGDEKFGAVKLNKLLFYSDFQAYAMFGSSITGEEYRALQQGPAPKYMKPVLDRMAKGKEIVIRNLDYFGRQQHKVFAWRPADLSLFTAKEIALVDAVIQKHWEKNGNELSDVTHSFVGWQLAKEGETIPYEIALVGRRQPTLNEIQVGKSLEALAKKCLAGTA